MASKHCDTCVCLPREKCTAYVKASDYRKAGRCNKFAIEFTGRCSFHPDHTKSLTVKK